MYVRKREAKIMYQLTKMRCEIGYREHVLAVVEDKDLEAAIEWYSKAISKDEGHIVKRTDWTDLNKENGLYWLGYKKIRPSWRPETGPIIPYDYYKRLMLS